MEDCHKGEKYGKGLFIEPGEATYNAAVDFEQEPEFDYEEIVAGEEGSLLVVRRVCFTHRKLEGEDCSHNIFQSTCTMGVRCANLSLIKKLRECSVGGKLSGN